MIKDIVCKSNIPKFLQGVGQWHVRYLVKQKAFPLACSFYITSRCNFKCTFCNIWRMSPSFQIAKDKAFEIIRDLGRNNLVYLSFSGGEPLLVPYIFDLLSSAKQFGIAYTHLVSNGYLMDKSAAKLLKDSKLSEISFSLDGNECRHDEIRCKAGAFERVIGAIDNVKTYSPKTDIVINTIFDVQNPKDTISAIKIAEKLKVKIKIQPLNEHPYLNKKNYVSMEKTSINSDYIQYVLGLLESFQKSPTVVNSYAFIENYKHFLNNPNKVRLANSNCLFGYHHVEIFNNKVFPCLEGLNWTDGFDLNGHNILDILKTDQYKEKLNLLKKCTGCKKNYYVCYYEPRLNFPITNLLSSCLERMGL